MQRKSVLFELSVEAKYGGIMGLSCTICIASQYRIRGTSQHPLFFRSYGYSRIKLLIAALTHARTGDISSL